ncbi:YoaK family protein [Nocardioides sp. SYSU DS0663]|uniref:YoaK family protein n=1 Tax=Nocardioides sp. SYSU DS0663 TaxID=3416445 RepID=UPI003F4B56A3
MTALGPRTEPGARRPRGPDDASATLLLMLVLTFTTGAVDAVGYLGLDKVFVGNMTGNVVILGMALTGVEGLPLLGPCLALGGFLLGAAVAGRVLRRSRPPWDARVVLLLASVGLVCLALAAVATAVRLEGQAGVAASTALGVVMGLQAGTARFVAVRDVTTVVVTSTLTGLAAESFLGNGAARRQPGASARRVAAVALMLLGALLGAALLQVHLALGLLVPGLLVLAVAGYAAARFR